MNSISTCAISSERVNDLDAGFFEIVRIPRGNDQAMNERSRGDQTVLERHRVTGSAPLLEMVVVMPRKIPSYLQARLHEEETNHTKRRCRSPKSSREQYATHSTELISA